MLMVKIYLILLTALLSISCKKTAATPTQTNSFYKELITADDRKTITPKEAKTYYINPKNKYEYRTGESDHYEYNYDVKGINAKGDSVFGNINIEGKYGAGILNTKNFRDTEINIEWVDHGKLKAIDKNGNEYNLVVD